MAKLGISTGITPNDGTGDSLLLGAIKINSNFSDIYTYFGDGTNLTSIGGTWGNTSVGIHTLKNVGIGTTNPTSKLTVSGDGSFTGVVTATTFVGNVTGTATTATLSTSAQGLTGTPNINVGVATASRLNVGTSGTIITSTTTGLVGIGTTNPGFLLEVGTVGASGTTLFVNGDARVTGIVTIGPASITLNGITNTVNVGTGITLNGSTGIISATAIVLGGTTLTGAAVTFITAGSGISVDQGTGNVTITATGGGGSSQFVTTAVGIHTLSNIGIGTTNPTSKLTVSGDGSFTGVVTATTFSGSGSGLTNISSGQLSGALPAIDGSALTGVVGSGSGVIIKDDGSSVGTAGTIDFGANLSVSFSSGIATITATGGGGSSQFVTTAAGIHTLSSVGIGTTNPISALTVTGDGIFTGVITATTFVGALTGTAINAQGLTGTPNITVGILTTSTLNVGTSGTIITTTTAGLVGIGTTNPTSKLTVSGDVLVSDKIVAGLTSSIIPFYWENFSDLPSFSTYHGAFAHVHQTGKAYYAHTRWVELVHTEASGVVGTGTERYNVGVVTTSTLNVGTGGTIITTTTAGLVGIGTTNPTEKLTVIGVTSSTSFYGDASYTASGRWTLGANGFADYTFTGIGFTQTTNDPVLYLARGRVYEFVNNSGGSHPFQIRVSDGGSAYSNGVTNNGGASGVIKFEIPFNAPNTLYYQCTAHSGMGNTISVYPNTI